MWLRTANGVWGGDFWEHAAVVRELMTHPTTPVHPLIATDAPNAFVTPYSVTLAAFARWFSLDPIGVLSIAGMLNLVLLCVTFERFVMSVVENGRTAFYGLLFHFFLWGWRPWEYSGFLHFGSLPYVLPYPSTIAIACVFAAWTLTHALLKRPRPALFLALFGLSAFVLLVHALSAVILVAGQGALIIAQIPEQPRRTVALGVSLAATFAAAVGAATFWPFYPFWDLLTDNAAFHDSNPEMYENVLARTFPAMVGLSALWMRFRANRFDPLAILFVLLTTIYIGGWFTGQWTYGRVLSFMVLLLHLAMAGWFAKWREEKREPSRPLTKWLAAAAIAMAIFAAINFREAVVYLLPATRNNYDQYQFLTKHVGQYDVVMTDSRTGWFVPPFGGKVIAGRSMAFISDREQRRADIRQFFSLDASLEERLALLARYDVDYLLLNRGSQQAAIPEIRTAASEWGQRVYSDAKFELWKSFAE
jgi:hypothetical protein